MVDVDSLLDYHEIVRKLFGSEDEGFEFYNEYAREKGFSVRKEYCEWDIGKTVRTLRKFVCSCQGFRDEKELKREIKKRRPRYITRCGCHAKLVIALDKNTGQWYVKEFVDEHNHPMMDPDLTCFLRSHRSISDDQKADIVEMQIAGIRKHKIMDIMERRYGGYDKVGFTARDLYNFCHSNKVETLAAGDSQTVISYLTECKRRDPDFFYQYKTDGSGHLTGVFWCDFQCQVDYKAFGNVLLFDGTYKTNRYNMPLVPFVGVNHHRSTVLFACGILARENSESYVWLLRSFCDAMTQKHPVSVITDGDLAMAKAIRIVWPNSFHRLCGWHIELNIVRNVKDDDVKTALRCFLYDRCSVEEIERKWMAFMEENEVTDTESWLYQMYEMRELWCAAYHDGKCYLGLRSNQRSESLHSRIQFNLDRKMTLFELVRHYDHCLARLRGKEADLDSKAFFSPCLQPDASVIEKEASKLFTPGVFLGDVHYSIKAAEKCYWIETLDRYHTVKYIVGKVDKGEIKYFVECQICVVEGNLKGISCSCQKLQAIGTPCSHIFFVLGYRDERTLPECCVLKRWTSRAKDGFPPLRKSIMYDYPDSLQRFHELRNVSQTASFVASQSTEAYERLMRVLNEEAAMIPPNGGENGCKRFGPVLPQAPEDASVDYSDVLDPIHMPGRGAPKKKLKSVSDKNKSKTKCSLCKGEGHNRRTCPERDEETKLPEDVLDM